MTNWPQAVLWDLDGTLIDSEPLWMDAETRLAEEYGQTWTPEDGLQLVGMSLLNAGAYIQKRLSLPLSPPAIVDLLVTEMEQALDAHVPWRPGAEDVVAMLAAEGIPQALVTSSYRPIADAVMKHLPFDASVAGDEVSNPKPHPEPYEKAAQLLGLNAEDCLAVEDSNTGALAAESAGAIVLTVPHMVAIPAGPRRVHRNSLVGLTLAEIQGVVASTS